MVKKIENPLDQYVVDVFGGDDEVLTWIQEQADKHDIPAISVRPDEGRLLMLLALSIGAKRIVEIGALAGYSGVWLARALPSDGVIYSLERSSKHATLTRASYDRAGMNGRAHVIEGNALDSLRKLEKDGPFDFVFIDADKVNSPNYLNWAIENLRPGGMVACHNAMREGRIIAPATDDDRAMHVFNQALAANPRLYSTIITMGDGMAVGIKRS